MLDSFRVQAAGFAPESKLNVGRGIFPRLDLGGFVGCTGSRGRLNGLAAIAQDREAEQKGVNHDSLLAPEIISLLRTRCLGDRTVRRRAERSCNRAPEYRLSRPGTCDF